MAFGKKILDIREKEAEYTRKDKTAGMFMHFSWLLAPFAVSFLYPLYIEFVAYISDSKSYITAFNTQTRKFVTNSILYTTR